MRDSRILRRSFLAGAGTTVLSTLLRPLLAHAQSGVAPQRLLLIHHPCGSSSLGNGRWWPTGGTKGWTASPLLSSFTDGKIASLQNNMVVLQGLTCPRNMYWLGDAHGSGFLGMMTPPMKDSGPSSWPQSASATASTRADPNSKTITAGDQSIDQLFLSQIPALKGAPCPIPSVQLTASTESSDQTNDIHALRVTSYAKASGGGQPTPLWPEPSPAAAFQNYFAAGVMNMTPAQVARAAAENKSVLDFASGGLTSLQTQVPRSQLPKVQAHLDARRSALDGIGGIRDADRAEHVRGELSVRIETACFRPEFDVFEVIAANALGFAGGDFALHPQESAVAALRGLNFLDELFRVEPKNRSQQFRRDFRVLNPLGIHEHGFGRQAFRERLTGTVEYGAALRLDGHQALLLRLGLPQQIVVLKHLQPDEPAENDYYPDNQGS